MMIRDAAVVKHQKIAAPCTAPGFLDTEGDTNIAPPPSIVDPDATERSRFIGHAATAAIRAATGV